MRKNNPTVRRQVWPRRLSKEIKAPCTFHTLWIHSGTDKSHIVVEAPPQALQQNLGQRDPPGMLG